MHLATDDYATQSNFATIDPASNVVLRRRADRDFHHWGTPLCDFLTGRYVHFAPSTGLSHCIRCMTAGLAIEHSLLPSFPDVRVDVKYATEHR